MQDVPEEDVAHAPRQIDLPTGFGPEPRDAVGTVCADDEVAVRPEKGLDVLRVDLAVKLQTEEAASQPECLVRADRARREELRAGGQVEHVAVPVQRGRLGRQSGEGCRRRSRGESARGAQPTSRAAMPPPRAAIG